MVKACDLAKKGSGLVSPNPLVGALLVNDQGDILSTGYHAYFGGPHAEDMAFSNYPGDTKDLTLICTLEPCCHTNKKRPPCLDLILKRKVKRVIIGSIDPNPEVASKSVEKLLNAGIEVLVGIEKERCDELIAPFRKFITKAIPYIHLKWAQSINGAIAENHGVRTPISGDEAQRLTHQWRFEADSVLIGGTTAFVDDPKLSIRLGDKRDEKIPWKIVIASERLMERDYENLFKDPEKVIVFGKSNLWKNQKNRQKLKNLGICLETFETENNLDFLNEMLASLAQKKIGTILVEGGSNIHGQFLEHSLYDRLSVFIAAKFLIPGVPSFSLQSNSLPPMPTGKARWEVVGNDILWEWKKCLQD